MKLVGIDVLSVIRFIRYPNYFLCHFIETCRCPEFISTNYYVAKPYLFRDESLSKLDGLFPEILSDMIEYSCGQCNRPGLSSDSSILDREKTGKGTLAQKRNQKEALEDADKYTELTFPITAHNSVKYVSGMRYVTLVQHPGLAIVALQPDVNSVVNDLISELLKIWPILFINIMFMILAGALVWILVSL